VSTPLTRRTMLGRGAVGFGALISHALLRPGLPVAQAMPSPECSVSYAGYSASDYELPYASYFTGHTYPPQPVIPAALARGPVPSSQIPPPRDLGKDLANPGYGPLETGYGQLATGEIWVAALTEMPGVRPQMWDWWFGWHSDASAKYKLWHPDAHRFAALENDLVSVPGLTDKQRYIGNVSYVDEFIGVHEQQLAIAFVDPSEFGIDLSSFDGTCVCGHVGSSVVPLNVAILAHQVRVTKTGSEMRSRFYLNVYGTHVADSHAAGCAAQRPVQNQAFPPFDLDYGAALMQHCGAEMNHLSRFLPELYAQFGEPAMEPLELDVSPRCIRVGHRSRLRFTATAGGAGVPEVEIKLADRIAVTDRAGSACITFTPNHAGSYTATATRKAGTGARVQIRALRKPSRGAGSR
jgi:DAPG hydrolase PhiG domain